jgi:hypothetical protein
MGVVDVVENVILFLESIVADVHMARDYYAVQP